MNSIITLVYLNGKMYKTDDGITFEGPKKKKFWSRPSPIGALSAHQALSEQLTAGAKRGVKHEGAETVTRAKPS